jgi:Mn-dependent DtxR family transcriptional regulator
MTDDEVLKAIADVESVKHRPTVDELARRLKVDRDELAEHLKGMVKRGVVLEQWREWADHPDEGAVTVDRPPN